MDFLAYLNSNTKTLWHQVASPEAEFGTFRYRDDQGNVAQGLADEKFWLITLNGVLLDSGELPEKA